MIMEKMRDDTVKTMSTPATLTEFIAEASAYLKRKGIPDARLNSELMLCDILECDRMQLYLNFDKPLSRDEINIFRNFLSRRASREPLQYILGKVNFYGYEFFVDKSVLIPRPETELLVEKVLEDISGKDTSPVRILEIGTGSGCISITLAKELDKIEKNYEIISIDKSEDAIKTALKNSSHNGLQSSGLKFEVKDVFEYNDTLTGFDYIVSNPPYVSLKEYEQLEPELKNHEPVSALTDFDDGLRFYDRIFSIASAGGFRGKMLCETGAGTREKLMQMLDGYGMAHYEFYKDYNGIDRILRVDAA